MTVPDSLVFDVALKDLFNDIEGDAYTTAYTISPTASWINFDSTTEKLSGYPPDNTAAHDYTISVTATNTFTGGTLTNTLDISMKVKANQPPVLGSVQDKQTLVPNPILYDLGASFFSDPEGLAYTKAVTQGDGSNLPSFITWTESNHTIYIEPSNADADTYTIKVSATDDYNPPSETTFQLVVTYNQPPVRSSSLEDIRLLVYSFFDV